MLTAEQIAYIKDKLKFKSLDEKPYIVDYPSIFVTKNSSCIKQFKTEPNLFKQIALGEIKEFWKE